MREDMTAVSIHEVYDAISQNDEYDFDNDKYRLEVLGTMTFGFIDEQVQFFKKPMVLGSYGISGRVFGDLMTGKEFFGCVDDGCIIDYDGNLGEVYVDGYRSNLGLAHEGFCQGGFLVGEDTWLEICDTHEVLVEWCNR